MKSTEKLLVKLTALALFPFLAIIMLILVALISVIAFVAIPFMEVEKTRNGGYRFKGRRSTWNR